MRSPVRASGRQLRLAAAAALVGVVLWSPASAEPAGAVTFTGGCGLLGTGLGARSNPDVAKVSIAAGSEVEFANQLGHPATLRLDGNAAADLAPGATAEVTFYHGPVTATMQISCLIGKPSGAVAVDVVQDDQPHQASPPLPPAVSPPTAPSPAGSGSTGGTGDPDQSSAPRRSGSGSDRPDGSGQRDPGPATGAPSGGQAWSAQSPGGQTPGDAPPASSGQWWPGSPGAGTPGAGSEGSAGVEFDTRWGDPADGGGRPASPATVDEQATGEGLAADELTRTAESAPGGEPIGLLALIATVCVVGVSAGAVRTLIARRAGRAEWA